MAKRSTHPEEFSAFYAEHDTAFERCALSRGAMHMPAEKAIISAARDRFGYSPQTNSRDILNALLRGWRKWRKANGPDKGPPGS